MELEPCLVLAKTSNKKLHNESGKGFQIQNSSNSTDYTTTEN